MTTMDLIKPETLEQPMAQGASRRISPSYPPITTVILREHATFLSPEGDEVRLRPGEYAVAVTAERHMHLAALDGHREVRLRAFADWHDFELDAPMALPVGEREPQIMLMMPGGRALVSPSPMPGQIQGTAPLPVVIDALLAFLPLAQANGYPINKNIFGQVSMADVLIEPSPAPTGFEPMTTPPNWHGAYCAAGSGWRQAIPPHQFWPNVDQDPPPSPVGQPRYRGAFPDYYMATDTVRVSSSQLIGAMVTLRVKSWTAYLRVMSMVLFGPVDEVWEDEYQLPADANGDVTFPSVIVATAHAPSYPPPPGTTWASIAAQEFTPPGSIGAYVQFAVSRTGPTIRTRTCHFSARAPGQPRLVCT
jgi:hypothetical protein